MTDRRVLRIASTGARVLAGALVSAVFVIAVVTAVALPWPTRTQEPVSVLAMPAPTTTVSVCGGPLLALGRDAQNAAALSVAAQQNIVTAVPAGDPAPERSSLSVPGTARGGADVLTAPPKDGQRALVSGAGSATVQAPDLTGFAASACQEPRMESWLVGGATTTGASDLVRLANPGAVPATVQLTVYGASGPQVPPGGSALVVAPGTERIVPLAGLILGEEAPVVHVMAAGAPVRAALQASLTRTLVPGGVDQVSAVPAAERVQVIPGVTVVAQPNQGATQSPSTVLRILSPAGSTTATVTVLSASGADEQQQSIPLTAGIPAEVELSGLAAGPHTVRIEAGAQIVSAAWSTTGFGAGADFAWYPAVPEVAAATIVSVPAGPSPVLAVANPGTKAAGVRLAPVDGGSARMLTIPAGGTLAVPVAARAAYTLEPQDGARIRASLSFAGANALADIPVWPGGAAARGVLVYPG
jgi:hypothetical protein